MEKEVNKGDDVSPLIHDFALIWALLGAGKGEVVITDKSSVAKDLKVFYKGDEVIGVTAVRINVPVLLNAWLEDDINGKRRSKHKVR